MLQLYRLFFFVSTLRMLSHTQIVDRYGIMGNCPYFLFTINFGEKTIFSYLQRNSNMRKGYITQKILGDMALLFLRGCALYFQALRATRHELIADRRRKDLLLYHVCQSFVCVLTFYGYAQKKMEG